ncbi:MAG: hypothetical protein JO108_10450, partial [Acidobacteriaceae bacterium]|nr:hypothetical protein [Acidobacteriaceae bacterium]
MGRKPFGSKDDRILSKIPFRPAVIERTSHQQNGNPSICRDTVQVLRTYTLLRTFGDSTRGRFRFVVAAGAIRGKDDLQLRATRPLQVRAGSLSRNKVVMKRAIIRVYDKHLQ